MSDSEAYAAFKAIRFADNGGEPYCPHCGCTAVYSISTRAKFKCVACEKQFSLTSQTVFHSRKLTYQDILCAIVLFVNGVNGLSASYVSRVLKRSYKSTFVLLHKLRRAMADMQAEHPLTGEVEVDGLAIGGFVREGPILAERENIQKESAAKRRVIVSMRERRKGGRSRAYVFKTEAAAVPKILEVVQPAAHLITDKADHWAKFLLAFKGHSTVNHSVGYSIDGEHINYLEGHHARIRRAQRGVYLKINDAHAQNYADELSWRDDHRRHDNRRQFELLARRASKMTIAREWEGYWRKRPARVSAAAPGSSGSACPF